MAITFLHYFIYKYGAIIQYSQWLDCDLLIQSDRSDSAVSLSPLSNISFQEASGNFQKGMD